MTEKGAAGEEGRPFALCLAFGVAPVALLCPPLLLSRAKAGDTVKFSLPWRRRRQRRREHHAGFCGRPRPAFAFPWVPDRPR